MRWLKTVAVCAGSLAAFSLCMPDQPARAAIQPRRVAPRAGTGRAPRPPAPSSTRPVPVETSPYWPAYDEILLVLSRGIMTPPTGGYFAPGSPLTAGVFLDAVSRLRKEYMHRGMGPLPTLPVVSSRAQPLKREEAVDLLVKALVPSDATPKWTPEYLSESVLDAGRTDEPFQASVALAAERLFLPNPLRPTDAADRAFAASILARAFPWSSAVPPSGPYQDEIRKALSMHLFFSAGPFPDSAPVTTAMLARAVARARMYVLPSNWTLLPQLPSDSQDRRPLTRAEAITAVVKGLIADIRLNPRLTSLGVNVVDPDCRVAYALGPTVYLAKFKDADTIPDQYRGPVAVGTYKGLLANLNTEPGQMKPNAPATLGYAAALLSRLVSRPGDYTGIILDMSGLKPLERSGGMYILNAGESTETEMTAVQVYPSSAHLPVGPFFAAPGALAYYGDVQTAQLGRAGRHPLIIQPLDWARYDWSTLHGDPGLRRGGGKEVPLANFHFVRGTPPLILLAPADAKKIQQLDRDSLLLRTARMALVQPNWSLTARAE